MQDAVDRYLTTQLIAYIGNKRRLLPALGGLFRRLASEHPVQVMLDPFAGSGAVSRLGRSMGFRVLANDWEEYSRVINRTHLCLSPANARSLFRERGGLEAVLARINTLDGIPPLPYFSRYYAPASTDQADYRTERLFYTRENALFLDRARGWIEEEYPPEADQFSDAGQARELLIAMLLYEAATHANTSGVFKAFHKGFGGHGKDALKRIMSPMELEYPVLIDGPAAEVGCGEAAAFSRGRSCDLCYLDPPYTIHQYGSNYHLLNSLARWDSPPASLELGEDGRLLRKAGIREDWTSTRSSYCRRGEASGALEDLLQTIDARRIVLSYNSEGLIPMETLTEIMSRTGRLEIFSEEYTQYRGGKQGMHRRNTTTEFQLVLTRGLVHRGRDSAEMRRFLQMRELTILLQSMYHPERLASLGRVSDGALHLASGGGASIPLQEGWRCAPPAVASIDLKRFDPSELEALRLELEEARFRDNGEEARILLELMAVASDAAIRREMRERFFLLLRKLAHKKYRDFFWTLHGDAAESFARRPWAGETEEKRLEEIAGIARRRFDG
jgi:adenine-specific DNA-methyltransferase